MIDGNRSLDAEFRFTVPEEAAGKRLDQFLADQGDLDVTRSRAQGLIRRGRVRVAGRTEEKSGCSLRAGDAVEVVLPPPEPVDVGPEAIPLDVVFEDADLLVVNKPRGMVVHPAPGHSGGTLVNALLAHCPDLQGINDVRRPGIVHRLDRDTTGLLVVAKTEAAYRSLARQLKDRTMGREYLALVHGLPPEEGTVEAPVGRHPRDRKRMAVTAGGRAAVSRYRVLERFPAPRGTMGGGYALLAVRLETGRTHQIRVHMAHIGHPVAGDPVYGAGERAAKADRRLGLTAQALHAGRIAFTHPRTDDIVELSVPPPADMAAALARLREREGG